MQIHTIQIFTHKYVFCVMNFDLKSQSSVYFMSIYTPY